MLAVDVLATDGVQSGLSGINCEKVEPSASRTRCENAEQFSSSSTTGTGKMGSFPRGLRHQPMLAVTELAVAGTFKRCIDGIIKESQCQCLHYIV